MYILALESSCDDTAAAVLNGNPDTGIFEIVAEQTATQVIHKQYGGVVPEVAAREHADHIALLIQEVLTHANITKPDVVAVTAGPGLVTSLLVGTETARALALRWGVPLIPINHIEGHIYANWISKTTTPAFPLLTLIASDGHTELILMKNHDSYDLLGKTLDDAAGECFDKIAKMMGMPYPGGPKISACAAKAGDAKSAYTLPRPMLNSGDYTFSFSGLKTAARYILRDHPSILADEKEYNAFAQEVENAILETLVHKTIQAACAIHPEAITVGGGVAANQKLSRLLQEAITKKMPTCAFIPPQKKYSTDNAAMIATAAFFHVFQNGLPSLTSWQEVTVNPQWRIAS